jgi:hypothetical protein
VININYYHEMTPDDYCPCDGELGPGIWNEDAEVLVRKCGKCGAEQYCVVESEEALNS